VPEARSFPSMATKGARIKRRGAEPITITGTQGPTQLGAAEESENPWGCRRA
jgi:hypothetical protein